MSVKFQRDNEVMNNAVEYALTEVVLTAEEKIIEITPRDPNRPPENINAKVTGSLKRSITHEQIERFKFAIWTQQGQAEYGKYLEFGTIFMKPRSFLRKWIADNTKLFLDTFKNTFASFLERHSKIK